MSDALTRFAGLAPATDLLSLSPWITGAVAALIVVLCLLAFSHAGREGVVGALARVALVTVAAGVSWVALESSLRRDFAEWQSGFDTRVHELLRRDAPGFLEATSRSDVAAERRVLDARVHELLTRAGSMPGSAFACLEALAGDTVEAACERALFQTPEATAAAVSYTSAQLTLLADLTMHVRQANARDEPAALGNLRRAIERDRFGLVAHVLAIRDGCMPDACDAFVLLDDRSRIRNNLAERTYDANLVRHSAVWSNTDKLPVATVAPRAAPATPGMGPGLFLSSESIPPVNIVDPESRAPVEITTAPAPSVTARVPMPPPRPARMGGPSQAGTNRQLNPPLSRMDRTEQERGSKAALTPSTKSNHVSESRVPMAPVLPLK